MHLYIHIPFCRKACHYCNFHFSTSLRAKTRLLEALEREILMRKTECPPNRAVETVYLGGGTPSLLKNEELESLFATVFGNYAVSPDAEITLEANPDDLTEEKIAWLAGSPVNRLSIGIQSFREADLKFMNRSHDAAQARRCLRLLQSAGFGCLSVDFIYGTPGLDDGSWLGNLEEAVGLGVPHISAYCLTVEPRTALANFVKRGVAPPVNEGQAARQFELLVGFLGENGYEHYETSNFCLPGKRSRHNSAYWQGKPYMGFGPSAHSFRGDRRSWNVAGNAKYMAALEGGLLPSEGEVLTLNDRFNEYLMTSLRTLEGCDLGRVGVEFGEGYLRHLARCLPKYADSGLVVGDGTRLSLTLRGKFLADGIISDLFVL